MKEWYVYIVANKLNTMLYTWFTQNINRIDYKTKKINKLVYYERHKSLVNAMQRVEKIRKLKRDKKNIMVNQINPWWVDLSELL